MTTNKKCNQWHPRDGGVRCQREVGHGGDHRHSGLAELIEWPNLEERIAELNEQLNVANARVTRLEAALREVAGTDDFFKRLALAARVLAKED